MHLTFYTKAGCPLCEDAEELLERVAETLPLQVEKLDIYRDQELFDRYRYRVPVIRIGNSDVLELRFTYEQLLQALSAAQHR